MTDHKKKSVVKKIRFDLSDRELQSSIENSLKSLKILENKKEKTKVKKHEAKPKN